MSVINETEIEQLYLARYDPLLQIPQNRLSNYGAVYEGNSTIDTISLASKPKNKEKDISKNSPSRSSLTSWKSQKLLSKSEHETEDISLLQRFISATQKQENLEKDAFSSRLRHLQVAGDESESSTKLPPYYSRHRNNNQYRQSVKEVVNVWPPKRKNNLARLEEEEDDNSPRENSPSGHVRDVLKRVYGESPPTSVILNDIDSLHNENISVEYATNPLELSAENLSSKKTSQPLEESNNGKDHEPPKENLLPIHPQIHMEDAENSQNLRNSTESPKDPRRFIKNIGPTSPVGLLALVTRELSQNIHPVKLLKSPKERFGDRIELKEPSKPKETTHTSSSRKLKKFRNKTQPNRNSEPRSPLSTDDENKVKKQILKHEIENFKSPSLKTNNKQFDKKLKRSKQQYSRKNSSMSRQKNYKKLSPSHNGELDTKHSGAVDKKVTTNTHSSIIVPESSMETNFRSKLLISSKEDNEEKFWTFTTSVVFPKAKIHGIADHPERDSLDGNLPGSSHGTSSGNPPPPPTPPGTSSNGNDTGGNINNNNIGTKNNNVNNNPDGSPPAEGENANFSKGPNAKSKKHKRLKTDNGTLDFPSREKESSKKAPRDPSPKNRDIESGGFRTKTEPYTYLWVVLSRMYGKLIILLMLAFCLTEVLDNKIAPLTFQEVFLLYLYVGSIVAIMCIYVTVIIDNCPSITASKENLTKTGDPEVGSITSFGTLKRAHISRSKTSRTSFYLRVGALVFGLGTLIYNGLEIAMQSAIPEGCISDTILAHPIMQALFTFLQMHFLFVNSEVIVEKFGQIARFGFMHLVATNLALWVRMVVWESANDSMTTYQERGLFDSPGGPKALGFHSLELQRLSKCYQNNTLGQLWIDSQQYLFPFIVQYSLIAASVTYIMWCNVGKERIRKLINNKIGDDNSSTLDKRSKGHWQVDCRSASKGLFLGLLVLVGGIVILIIFFVMKDHTDFRHKLFWMNNGTMMVILSLCIIATIFGFIQIPKLSVSTIQPMDLDRLLLSITVVGVYIFAIFGMIVGGIDYNNSEKLATFSTNTLLLIQVSLQGMLVAEASRRTCSNRFQMLTKPGRQVITFLLFSNITLWILDTFMTHNSITHQFQIDFYGRVVWGVISRISLPLMMLFRFHSAVILVEIWKNTYRTKAD